MTQPDSRDCTGSHSAVLGFAQQMLLPCRGLLGLAPGVEEGPCWAPNPWAGPYAGGNGGKPLVLRPPGPWSSALQMTTYLRTSSCLTSWPCASMGGCSSSRMYWGTRSAAGLSTGRAAKSPRCAAPPLSMPRRRSRPRSEGVQGLVGEGCGVWQDQDPGQRQPSRSGRGNLSLGVRIQVLVS